MKVKELLQLLSRLDPETQIIIPADSGSFVQVQQVVLDWAALSETKADLAYPDEPGVAVVRLVGPEGLDASYFRNASLEED